MIGGVVDHEAKPGLSLQRAAASQIQSQMPVHSVHAVYHMVNIHDMHHVM